MIHKIRSFCGSMMCALLFLLGACLVVLLKAEVVGMLVFVMAISLLLFLCDDITVTTLPFLLACMFVTKCYDSFDTFIRFAPLGVIPVGALLFHFIFYRKKFRIGSSFYGILAVALSVTLGGAFIITPKEYFSGTSLYYVLGLGIGMAAVYLLMKSAFVVRPEYDIRERLLAFFYIAGLFGCFMVFSHYAVEFSTIRQTMRIKIQWSNNISTMLMLFMPVPFYYALTRNRANLLVGLLFYAAIVMTGSRGGLLMGGVELILCFLFVAVAEKSLRLPSLALLVACSILLVAGWEKLAPFIGIGESSSLISSGEVRYKLIFRAFDDFKANPIFGRGLGYTGNSDCYHPVKGAANWYHMFVFQIIGSLGLLGVAAYLFQFVGRLRLIFQKTDLTKLTFGLCYAGMLLMSMVNPGEFCPIPYEMLTVLLFIFLEFSQPELEAGGSAVFCPFKIEFSKKAEKPDLS